MRQVAVVLELGRGLLPAMCPSLSSYRSIVALKVQKSMVEAVARVPTRKDCQYKRVHTTDLYYRGWTAHRAPSTEANLVPEVGASRLCGSTSFARQQVYPCKRLESRTTFTRKKCKMSE
ncbi:uncharacterized protein LOC142575129 isoform X2 [Dermacentor variabilis]|uniref:uncharacterized protein LOC142575129 isoform X2 n=1 Tax=Dermacentor variabilis TaxID=34621 RepID=UPI003F5AE933